MLSAVARRGSLFKTEGGSDQHDGLYASWVTGFLSSRLLHGLDNPFIHLKQIDFCWPVMRQLAAQLANICGIQFNCSST